MWITAPHLLQRLDGSPDSPLSQSSSSHTCYFLHRYPLRCMVWFAGGMYPRSSYVCTFSPLVEALQELGALDHGQVFQVGPTPAPGPTRLDRSSSIQTSPLLLSCSDMRNYSPLNAQSKAKPLCLHPLCWVLCPTMGPRRLLLATSS